MQNESLITDLKLKSYIKALSDANECLRMEPGNVKALFRKGQAFIGRQMLSEAYDTFEKILDIDSTNQAAHKEMYELRKKLPPRTAFRMKIEEIEDYEESNAIEDAKIKEKENSYSQAKEPEPAKDQQVAKPLAVKDEKQMKIPEKPSEKRVITKSEKLDLPDSSHVPKMVKNLIVEEPTPFDKLTPKAKDKPRDTLIMPSDVQTKKKNVLIQEIN